MTKPQTAFPTAPCPPRTWEPAWYRGTLVGFDLETTGTDPATARVVTAAVTYLRADGTVEPRSRNWLVDPGVPIPAAAVAVHGVSTEQAVAGGAPAPLAIAQIAAELDAVWLAGLPLVIFNAAYDLSVMAAEAARHGVVPPERRPGWQRGSVVDPLVIDREVDRFRRGKRTLQAAALHYRVVATGAHSADGDAVAACEVARAIAATYPMIGNADLHMLHRAQGLWSEAWAARFQQYLRSLGQPTVVVDGSWPLRAA